MDNTVNNLRYNIKFENRVKDKNNFFIKQNIAFFYLFLETYFFKILKNLIAEADAEKHRYASAKPSNAALVKHTD